MQHYVDFKTAHDFSTLKQHPVDFSVGTRKKHQQRYTESKKYPDDRGF